MKAPLGKNEVRKFLSTAAKNAGLHREGKKVTNHSVRKTCISRLLDAEVPENFVAQLSCHKNTKSLQSYKSASAKYQKRTSLTLTRANLSGFRDETLSNLIMSCDIFGTRQTKILTLCYLLEKTYKAAQSSATLESLKSTHSTRLLEKLLT